MPLFAKPSPWPLVHWTAMLLAEMAFLVLAVELVPDKYPREVLWLAAWPVCFVVTAGFWVWRIVITKGRPILRFSLASLVSIMVVAPSLLSLVLIAQAVIKLTYPAK